MRNILFILVSVSMLNWACDSGNKREASLQSTDSIEVMAPGRAVMSKTLSLPAQLFPWERAEVHAKVDGYVREIKVDIGDRVRKNEILAFLDAPEVIAEYAKTAADLQAAKSRYQTSLDLYKRTVDASKEPGAVSAAEIERIRNQMLSDSSSWEASKAGAEAYSQLRNYLTIRAAFDGVITERNVHPGTLVSKEQPPMLVLENLSRLRLVVAIPEAYTSSLPKSASLQFTVDAQPSMKYSASFSRKSNQIDEETRTERWEFEVANPGKELKSGMYASASVSLRRSDSTFVVPFSAVVTTLEKRFVIRVRDGKTEWVDVRLGITAGDNVEVFGELSEADLLVRRASDEIKNGSSVVAVRI